MKITLTTFIIAILFLVSCTKSVEKVTTPVSTSNTTASTQGFNAPTSKQLVEYKILQGQQYCDKSTYQPIKYDSLVFIVEFDSSAIYKTTDESNQADINKLFGFSDNNRPHQEYSARFGWRWSNNALRLFGYTYNNSVRSSKELGTVELGTENRCAIRVDGKSYIFTLNGKSVTMPRESKTEKAEGYKLYPYFGGDEVAPHTISIWIKELSQSF